MPTLAAHGRLIRLTVLVFALFALAFLGGGGLLVWLGGSPYYLVAGLMLLATAWLLWRHPLHAFWLYIVLLAGTMVWSVIEVGLDGWQLVPRLDLWIVLGLWLALPWVPNRLSTTHGAVKLAREVTLLRIVLLLAAVLLVYGVFFRPAPGTLEGSLAETTAPGNQAAHFAPRDWSAYGHSGYGDRYAPLSQITPANVARLERAWEFHTGDFKGSGDPDEMANEVTPLKANGMLYICTPHNIVIALDPDTGRERWRFNPRINRDASHYQHMICRGVAYYDAAAYGRTAADSPAVSECPRRIYAPTADATLVAVNADTGQPCTRFGQRGVVDLKAGQGAIKRGALNPTSPPVVTNRILVASASVTDNDSTNEPSGVILGFDIDSGKLVWNWDSGNPDETTPLPPGRQYVRNSPNSWSVSSVDERLGLVYIPMGNQTPDIWGGQPQAAGGTLQQQHRRTGHRQRQTALGLPDGASRPLGYGYRRAADTGGPGPARRACAAARSAHQAWRRLRARPPHRPPAGAGARTPSAAGRGQGRLDSPYPAFLCAELRPREAPARDRHVGLQPTGPAGVPHPVPPPSL
nr:PQQ-binding-like beta-propeller repeat protein [Gulbenkiania indica]